MNFFYFALILFMYSFYIHALKYILFLLQSHEKTYKCDVCGASFGRKDVLTKHKKTHEKENRK